MGRHPYRVRDIAVQAGLSEATVDRVLNDRPGVRASTRREVRAAIADLDRQHTQLRIGGRTFLIDIVMQSPERFSSAVRSALEAELPSLRPATVRSRFHFRETWPIEELVQKLDSIGRRGSHGVILKAPDVPQIDEAVAGLTARGIPVLTLVTDLPRSTRSAYVGIDNRAAGATAAYLIDQWLGGRPGNVLVTLSRSSFRGEEERETGFRAALRDSAVERAVVEVTETDGLDATIRGMVLDRLAADPAIRAVYSAGGGNTAIVGAFDQLERACDVFIAHDLDADNTALLRDGRISAVLHHDLRADLRRAAQLIMAAQRAIPPVAPTVSAIQVVTPHNLPTG